ncbi:hypothetical protein G7085_03275 [Tessaracoccus sp. HDW20]|uniref:hypothetical protein n=1 Tax=Tessaracoccus coleopterorum TaxID=2714950 RepID=UPI0018D4065E|nr:hypothetical protein [Tessaracoccus coleopterorum]NHB84013.1 hypothetical protein [Tessaracoccus coleopterorum]
MSRRRVRAAWTIVARREIVAQLTDKAFWIGTITTLGIVVATFLISALVSGGVTPTRVAVASDEAAAVIAQAVATGARWRLCG